MLDSDLAELYGVETKVLNQAVKRNAARFPADFMFQLTQKEHDDLVRLRSQFVTLKRGEHRKYLPYAFTEHGALMLANVLNSERAAQTSVMVVRAFVRLRQMLVSNAELARKLAALENKYDAQFKVVFDAIRVSTFAVHWSSQASDVAEIKDAKIENIVLAGRQMIPDTAEARSQWALPAKPIITPTIADMLASLRLPTTPSK